MWITNKHRAGKCTAYGNFPVDIHAKTREASQNTDLDKREFLEIYKTLQTVHDELANNASKLTEINERIKKDSKNLKEVEDYPTYAEEQDSCIEKC